MASVLALLTDRLMHAPLVVVLPYAVSVAFTWLRWWRWRDRTDDTGHLLVRATVPRRAVARDPAIVFRRVPIHGVLVIGDGVWEWRPPRLTRHQFPLPAVESV